MARLLGPDANSRLVYALVGGSLASTAGKTATIYSDAAGTLLADIATYDGTQTPGAVITGSVLTVDSTSQLPLFWFPASGADTLYAKVAGGPVTKINADYDARIDAGASSATGVYDVTKYGAKGDGVTDDTAAINSAIAAAVTAGQANGTNYAEVYFPPLTYLLSGATTKTASNKGNSQIWLPLIATTVQKFVLVLRGSRAATALPHWQQTTPQLAGSVLKSTLTGQTNDGTWGPPSVVGGPTVQQGYGANSAVFNNMCIVLDGISVVVPANPTMLAFNFSGMAEANVISASANASTTPGSGTPTLCTNSWAYGLYMPQPLNNDLCNVVDFSAEGMFAGMVLSEHAVVVSCRIIYCDTGILIAGNQSDTISIQYASVEVCRKDIEFAGINGGSSTSLYIAVLDVEETNSGAFTHVYTVNDSGNSLRGYIGFHNGDPGGPTLNGATKIKVVNLTLPPGAATTPTLPSSGVASTPVWRDAYIAVTGGTTTAASVDGVAQGFTTTPFSLFVPSGKTFSITYSGAPTIKATWF
jgi:hypothetical protein